MFYQFDLLTYIIYSFSISCPARNSPFCACVGETVRACDRKAQVKSEAEDKHNRIAARAIFAKYLAGGIAQRSGKRGSRRDAERTLGTGIGCAGTILKGAGDARPGRRPALFDVIYTYRCGLRGVAVSICDRQMESRVPSARHRIADIIIERPIRTRANSSRLPLARHRRESDLSDTRDSGAHGKNCIALQEVGVIKSISARICLLLAPPAVPRV